MAYAHIPYEQGITDSDIPRSMILEIPQLTDNQMDNEDFDQLNKEFFNKITSNGAGTYYILSSGDQKRKFMRKLGIYPNDSNTDSGCLIRFTYNGGSVIIQEIFLSNRLTYNAWFAYDNNTATWHVSGDTWNVHPHIEYGNVKKGTIYAASQDANWTTKNQIPITFNQSFRSEPVITATIYERSQSYNIYINAISFIKTNNNYTGANIQLRNNNTTNSELNENRILSWIAVGI